MPKTIRNKFDTYLTYEKLMEAHYKSRKGKGYRKELLNKSRIKVKGYNEIADFCYRNLEKEINVFIEGYINSKAELVVDYIEIIDWKLNIF